MQDKTKIVYLQLRSYGDYCVHAWQQTGIDGRGVRKAVIAAILVTLAHLYLARFNIIEAIVRVLPFGSSFSRMLAVSLVVSMVGAIYLRKNHVKNAVLVTIVAMLVTQWLAFVAWQLFDTSQSEIIQDLEISYRDWEFIIYCIDGIILMFSYVLSYVLFSIRQLEKYKLGVAGIVIAAFIIATITQGRW